MPVADRPHHAGGWVDVQHRYGHAGGGGVHDRRVVGREKVVGVLVNVAAGGRLMCCGRAKTRRVGFAPKRCSDSASLQPR
ncbi:hypothetical protein GCM10027290_30090 [Micromonospora sonneratiae]